MPGNQSITPGTKSNRSTWHMSAIMNGITPLNTVCMGTLNIPLIVYTIKPIGGVIIAISITRTTIIPNHIGPKPKASAIGRKIGIVTKTMDIASIKHPRKKYMISITAITAKGGRVSHSTNPASKKGILLTEIKYLNR